MESTTEYNLAGQITKAIDFQGLVTTYQYINGVNTGSQRHGKKSIITHPGESTTITETACDGQTTAITGTAQVSQYYTCGVNAAGTQWQKTHYSGIDSARWEKNTTGMLGKWLLNEKSGFSGNVIQQYFYNSKNQLIKFTKTGRAPTLLEYDDLGNIVRRGLDIDGNAILNLTSSDRISDEAIYIDGLWKITIQKVYSMDDDVTATTMTIKKQRLNGFTAKVVAESQTVDIYGNTITQTQTIDRENKMVTVYLSSMASTISEQTISVNGMISSVCSRSNLTTTYAYDGLGRIVSVTEPRIGTTTITYHTASGKNGLKASVTNAAGNATTYDYDSTTGRLLWEKNALNQYTRYAYNSHGQVINIWGDTQYPVQYGYDQFGQKTTMRTFRTNAAWDGISWPTDVTGDLTTWTYDEASGLFTAKTDANNKSVTYTYTVDGKLATRTWARGVVTTYTYSPSTGELLNVSYSDNTPSVTYTYNRLGKPLTIQDAVGTRSFAYNDTFDLIKETINGIYSKELNRTYTTSGMKGRTLGMSIGNIQNYTYAYDDYGRINKITTPMGDFNYTRLANSDLVSQMTRPNGVTTTWNYEPNRNLITQVQNGTISTFGYINNAIGNRTSMTRSGSAFTTPDTLSYNYNNRSEVIGAISDENSSYNYTYGFDPIGNRLTAALAGTNYSYTANALNQYIAVNTQEPTYDFDGNMLTRDGWTQTWNGENRMIQAVKGEAKLQFAYDYMGRRVEKKVYDGESLTKHTRFVYDEYKLIEELMALNNNSLLQRYAWQLAELGIDVPLNVYGTEQNAAYVYTADANKNTSELLDSDGTIVAHYEYSPFGAQTAITGNYATANPFRASGEFFDSETDLVYYNYRYYSPRLGRWLNCDPIGEIGGNNLYATLYNNTINSFDINGLSELYIPIIDVTVKDDGRFCCHANWGGGGWANGGWVQDNWSQSNPPLIDPKDKLDSCYKKHDICYEKCRSQHPNCLSKELACQAGCDKDATTCQLNVMLGSSMSPYPYSLSGQVKAPFHMIGLTIQGLKNSFLASMCSIVGL